MPATAPSSRRVPTQERSRRRVAEVLDAAARIVVSDGVEALTTREIARAAGVPVATLYQYFADKEAVLIALAQRDMDEMDIEVAEAVTALEQPTVASVVRATMEAFVRVYHRRRSFVEIYLRGRTNVAVHEFGRAHNERTAASLRDYALDLGLVRAELPPAFARMAVEVGDRIFQLAFEHEDEGDAALVEEGIVLVTGYLERYATPLGAGALSSLPLRESVAAAARRLAHEGLVVGTAGNVSARSGDLVAVTASGVALAGCRWEDVTVVTLDGTVAEGALRPTSELALHLGVYADTGAAAVVHAHAPWSTALACVLDELPVLHYQQLLLGGAIRVAPYATFGTPELAASVREALVGRQAALMGNHGSVAVGDSLDAAVEHALLLEWLAALHHRASALGEPRVLTAQEQDDVVRQALATHYGTPGAEA